MGIDGNKKYQIKVSSKHNQKEIVDITGKRGHESLILNCKTIKTQNPISNGRVLNYDAIENESEDRKRKEKTQLQEGKEKAKQNKSDGKVEKKLITVSSKHKPRMITDIEGILIQKDRGKIDMNHKRVIKNKSLILNCRTIKTQNPISNGRILNYETIENKSEGRKKKEKVQLQEGKEKQNKTKVMERLKRNT